MLARRIIRLGVVLSLAACGDQQPPPSPEFVESLVANPQRLRELRAACKADHAAAGDARCRAAAEATRQRFMRGANAPSAPVPPERP